MSSKKYYWLKLKDDFFTSREIKKLRRIAGGDTYTIIYLKLQLLTMKNDGMLIYEGTESNLAEQLSLELDEDEENIKVTLSYLIANKLMEQIDTDTFLIPQVIEQTGSETKAAERMRRMREKRNIVIPMLSDVQKCDTEIEIEIEIEKDIDIEKDICSPEASEPAPKEKKNLNNKRFEEFWNTYPRKIGKKKAQEIYKKLNPNQELHNQIITAINQQKTSIDWTKENGQYIPHPTTWLNQGRWDDELEPGKENPNAKRETATTGKRLGIYL